MEVTRLCKHINLAYSVLRALRRQRNIDMFGIANGKPSVIDFDCGSRAMQFATAIAAADSYREGERV